MKIQVYHLQLTQTYIPWGNCLKQVMLSLPVLYVNKPSAQSLKEEWILPSPSGTDNPMAPLILSASVCYLILLFLNTNPKISKFKQNHLPPNLNSLLSSSCCLSLFMVRCLPTDIWLQTQWTLSLLSWSSLQHLRLWNPLCHLLPFTAVQGSTGSCHLIFSLLLSSLTCSHCMGSPLLSALLMFFVRQFFYLQGQQMQYAPWEVASKLHSIYFSRLPNLQLAQWSNQEKLQPQYKHKLFSGLLYSSSQKMVLKTPALPL